MPVFSTPVPAQIAIAMPVPVPISVPATVLLPVIQDDKPAHVSPVIQPPPPPPSPPIPEVAPNPAQPLIQDGPAPPDDTPPPTPALPLFTQAMVDMPSVQLLPPTPNTSQEAAIYAPTTLLEVPAPIPVPTNRRSNSRSRSPSPATGPSDLRRSPRLASPIPSAKRGATEPLVEPAAKRQKGM